MKKWQKIEATLNAWLFEFGKSIDLLFRRIIKKEKSVEPKVIQPKLSKKEYFLKTLNTVKRKIDTASAPIRNKSQKIISAIQSIDVKKVNSKVFFASAFGVITAFLVKVKFWYVGLRPESILIFTVSSTVVSLSSINLYKASQAMIKESLKKEKEKEIDQVAQAAAPARRPAYYKLERLLFAVQEINFPVIIENQSSDVKTLLIDVEIQTSNRYIREYLNQNEHLVKDILSRELRPVIPSFPLEDEGKAIIKAKIIDELNELLQSLNIKGTIDDVLIVHIIAA